MTIANRKGRMVKDRNNEKFRDTSDFCDAMFWTLLGVQALVAVGLACLVLWYHFVVIGDREVSLDSDSDALAGDAVHGSADYVSDPDSVQLLGVAMTDQDEVYSSACVGVATIRDPCELRAKFGFHGGVPKSQLLPEEPPSYEEVLFNSYGIHPIDGMPSELLMAAAHIVARGTFVTGTTNCQGHPMLFPDWIFDAGTSPYVDVPKGATVEGVWNLRDWLCFTNFQVGEYLVGSGPEMIPVMHPEFGIPYDILETPSLDPFAEQLATYREELANAYEGYEWVLWLGPPPNVSVQSWAVYAYWDVQKDADGTVRVVSPDYADYRASGTTGVKLGTLNPPLDQFRRDVVAAHQSRMAKTSGRIGVATTTPDLVTSVEMLPEHFDEIGASDNPVATPVPPPVRPLTPAGLEAEAPSKTGIPLLWTAPTLSRITGYKVVRRVPKGEFVTVVADTGSTETTYTDTSAPMTAGVTYIYRVLALNEYGESLASNRATVELPGPDAPTDFTATNYEGDVVLTWTQPGVIMPSCYRIYRRAQGEQSFEWVVNCWSAELRSWRDDDVESGTRYIYRIVPMIGYTESGATARASVRVR